MTLEVDVHQRLGGFHLDADFKAAGGVTAIFGPSGSGKTSLTRIIAGLTRPDKGRVSVNGEVLIDSEKGILVPIYRRHFGYVFQDARLFPHLSVQQNLKYGRWFMGKGRPGPRMSEVIEMLGIGHLMSRRPGKLSGGEKQRVAIGRALLSAPRLLIMDEPLAALDNARKEEILPYLERLRDNTEIPIIYVTHAINEIARLADRVVVMDNGRVKAVGEAAEVLGYPAMPNAEDRREAGALIEGSLEPSEAADLSILRLKEGKLHLPKMSASPGTRLRVHISARDVILATSEPGALSALNVLPGTISQIGELSGGMVEIRVNCGGDYVLSRITRFSHEKLELEIGKPVYAIIKTVALV